MRVSTKMLSAYFLKSVIFILLTSHRVTCTNMDSFQHLQLLKREMCGTNNTKPGIVRKLTTFQTGHQMLVDCMHCKLPLVDIQHFLVSTTIILHLRTFPSHAVLLTILFFPTIIRLHVLPRFFLLDPLFAAPVPSPPLPGPTFYICPKRASASLWILHRSVLLTVRSPGDLPLTTVGFANMSDRAAVYQDRHATYSMEEGNVRTDLWIYEQGALGIPLHCSLQAQSSNI